MAIKCRGFSILRLSWIYCTLLISQRAQHESRNEFSLHKCKLANNKDVNWAMLVSPKVASSIHISTFMCTHNMYMYTGRQSICMCVWMCVCVCAHYKQTSLFSLDDSLCSYDLLVQGGAYRLFESASNYDDDEMHSLIYVLDWWALGMCGCVVPGDIKLVAEHL